MRISSVRETFQATAIAGANRVQYFAGLGSSAASAPASIALGKDWTSWVPVRPAAQRSPFGSVPGKVGTLRSTSREIACETSGQRIQGNQRRPGYYRSPPYSSRSARPALQAVSQSRDAQSARRAAVLHTCRALRSASAMPDRNTLAVEKWKATTVLISIACAIVEFVFRRRVLAAGRLARRAREQFITIRSPVSTLMGH